MKLLGVFIFTLFLCAFAKAATVNVQNSGITIQNSLVTIQAPYNPAASCTPNIVIVSSVASYFAGATSTNIALGSVTAGHLLVIALAASTVNGTMTLTNTSSATWTARTKVTEAGDGTQIQLFYATASITGLLRVAITFGSAGDAGGYMMAVSGMNQTAPYDTEGNGTNAGASTSLASSSFTTTQNSELVVSLLGNEGTSITNLVPSGTVGTFAKVQQLLNNVSALATATTTTIQTLKSAQWTWTTSGKSALAVATFKGVCP